MQWDASHGSSSHSVALRNWMCGENWYGSWQSGYGDCFALNWMTSTNSLIGNIAGCPKFVADGGRYLAISTSSYPGRSCFAFGFLYDNSGYTKSIAGYSSTLPWDSAVFHGNYDFVSQSQHWDANIANHTIPKTYFLPGKPAWFGSLNWPPIDPANPATATLTNLPAGYRYVFGVDPPTGPANLVQSRSLVPPLIRLKDNADFLFQCWVLRPRGRGSSIQLELRRWWDVCAPIAISHLQRGERTDQLHGSVDRYGWRELDLDQYVD